MSEKTINLLHLFSKILRNPKFMMALRMEMMSEKLRNRKGRNGAQGLLIELWKKDGLTNAEIAEILDIKPSSVTAQVKNLEAEDLVERRQDENDKRISRVFLTEKGKQAQEKREDLHDNISSDLFDVLDETEQKTLADLLEKIIEANKEFDFEDFWQDGGFDPREMHDRMRHMKHEMNHGFGGHGGFSGHDAQRERWAAMSDNERRAAMRDAMPFGEDWKKLFDNMKNHRNPWNFGPNDRPKPDDKKKSDDWNDF